MRTWLALLVTSLLAPHALATVTPTATMAMPGAPIGHPLLAVPFSSWAHAADEGPDAAIAAAYHEANLWRHLEPLGDANGDGRADVLAVDLDEETQRGHIMAISGRDGTTLWQAGVDGYAWTMGDADADGAREVAVVLRETFEQEGDLRWTMSIRVLSGATGKHLLARNMVYEAITHEESSGTWPISQRHERTFSVRIDVLVTAPVAGFEAFTFVQRDHVVMEQQLVLWRYSSSSHVAVHFERLLPTGGSLWKIAPNEGESLTLAAATDLTGDGIDDLLVVRHPDAHEESPLVPQLAAPTHTVTIQAFDRISGKPLWDVEAEHGALPFLVALGDLAGNGPEFGLATFAMEPPLLPGASQPTTTTTLTRFMQADGRGVGEATREGLALPLPFGDVDGDGIDEMMALEFWPHATATRLVDGTLQDVWPKAVHGYGFHMDTDGQQPVEMGIWNDERFTIHEASDGRVRHTLPPGSQFVGPIVGAGEVDVVAFDPDAGHLGMRLLRGSDLALAWSRPLVVDPQASAWAATAGDVNGDGVLDLIVNAYNDERQWAALVLNGATGARLLTNVADASLQEHSAWSVPNADTQVRQGPAARLQPAESPLAAPLALAALVAAAAVHHGRATRKRR